MKNKLLVIAPSSAHRNLFKEYREKDKFKDVKIVSKEELYHSFLNSYDSSYVAFLIHNFSLTYDFAKEIVSYFPYLDKSEPKLGEVTPKIAAIINYKKECEKSKDVSPATKPFFPELIYEDREIELRGYKPDDCYFLKLGLDLPKTLNIEPVRDYDVDYFVDADDEVLYVLNSISALISSGVSPSNIYISFENKDYTYLLIKYAPIFNLKINHLLQKTLNTTPICLDFIRKLEECGDVDLAIDYLDFTWSEDPNYGTLINLINENTFSFLSIEEQLLIFKKVFKEMAISSETYLGAINIISGPTFNREDHIFILGFALDYYPKGRKETSYLSEEEKEKIGYFKASDLNRSDKDDVKQFLSSGSNIHLSFSEYVFANKYYPVDPNFISQNFNKDHFVSEYFSREYAYINACKAEDLLSSYLQMSDNISSLRTCCPEFKNDIYGAFDYSFMGVGDSLSLNKVRLSYSSAKQYLGCPFSYYAKYILGIDDKKESFTTDVGTIAHKVFEKYYKLGKSFDFEKVFNEVSSEFKDKFDKREMILLESNLKLWINHLIDTFKVHDAAMGSKLTHTYAETYVDHYPIDEAGKIEINGKIDKAIITDNHYAYIVDYKSYDMKFKEASISNGESLQLPTYLLLSESEDSHLSSYEIAGVFYQRYLPAKPYENDTYYQFTGKILEEPEALDSFDPDRTFVKYPAKGEKATCTEDDFDRYKKAARDTYLEAGTRILNNDFTINPTFFKKSENACQSCIYKDICFRFSKVGGEEEEDEGYALEEISNE